METAGMAARGLLGYYRYIYCPVLGVWGGAEERDRGGQDGGGEEEEESCAVVDVDDLWCIPGPRLPS